MTKSTSEKTKVLGQTPSMFASLLIFGVNHPIDPSDGLPFPGGG
jgi:hypothetical protein